MPVIDRWLTPFQVRLNRSGVVWTEPISVYQSEGIYPCICGYLSEPFCEKRQSSTSTCSLKLRKPGNHSAESNACLSLGINPGNSRSEQILTRSKHSQVYRAHKSVCSNLLRNPQGLDDLSEYVGKAQVFVFTCDI